MERLRALAGESKDTWKTWTRLKSAPADKMIPALLEWWSARRDLITKARAEERTNRDEQWRAFLAGTGPRPDVDVGTAARGRRRAVP